MSAWCSDKGYEGAAAFLAHSQEEMEHMQRLFDYLSDTGALPLLGQMQRHQLISNQLAMYFIKLMNMSKLLVKLINWLI